ncbi:hypothetical protein BKA04_001558 [Cryobacterium mesophilum]|uniref:Uncharacterized protein n=1 Tax=Terrimesophilobacter mesophilus TaxID=433647 RepID=A0A4V3I9M5_9MICO|nr:hypothetical protein [Terrimesophilobacter mesophilus]MBB5633335.1 hypothetical protein [Terrimesophilobacter mesophilus]TFB80068.1 hypothetical protein E3N84_08435 [Terrimesophilobacter mesophilus]
MGRILGLAANPVLTKLTDELNQRDDVATRVDEAMRSAELEPFTREFSVQSGDAGIRQTSFERTPVDYAAELAYWGAIESVVGTGLTMTLGADRSGALQRILSTQTDATVATLAEHYDDIVATVPPAGAETMWRLPGIFGYADWLGPLPERSILSFMADRATVTDLLDDSVQEMPPGCPPSRSPCRAIVTTLFTRPTSTWATAQT